MRPIVFDGCTGWLHPGTGSRGVVLCNAFGQEAMWTHKGFRQLADRLAMAGVSALRFDYPGTGDSIGDEDEPGRVGAWTDSIKHAVRTLRELTGVTEVALVGLRLGAALAARAALDMGGVERIVMLAPVISGKTFLRELRALYQTWQSGTDIEISPEAQAGECVEVVAHRLYRDAVEDLKALDLRTLSGAPAGQLLLLDRNGREQSALLAHWSALGVDAASAPFDECDGFMVEAAYSAVPHKVFDTIVAWLAQGQDAPAATDVPACDWSGASAGLNLDYSLETPVRFGTKGLFGILSQPTRIARHRPALLFANTGASHHVGDGRLAATLARRLSRRGIASLRMDISGIGDSDAGALANNTDALYSDGAIEDIRVAADWLASQGYQQVVVFGLCSGGYIGMHAAVASEHIVGLIAVNLARFFWPEGLTIEEALGHRAESTRLYMRSAMRLDKWWLALRGQAHFREKVCTVATRLGRRGRSLVTDWYEDRFSTATGQSIRPRELMRQLETRKVETRLIYGAIDAGLDELAVWFGAGGRRLRKARHVQVVVMEKVDHALFSHMARERVMAYTEAYLEGTFGNVGKAPPQMDVSEAGWLDPSRSATPADEAAPVAGSAAA
jgi:pimeloyl-ACP methyl ester carboxylesterase